MSKKFFGGISIQNAQELGFFDADSSNFLAIKAPASLTGNTTLILPDGDSTGTQALVSDGSGNLSWASFLGSALASGKLLVGNGSGEAAAVTISGDISIDNAGLAAIAAGVIVDADINASAAIAVSKLAAVTASKALVSDGSGFISASSVSSTELGYVSGVTSGIQSQINSLSNLVNGLEFQDSALDYVVDNTAVPASEVTGNRYILSHDGGAPHANYDGASAGSIVEFDGASWVETVPTTGMFIAADDETTVLYYWGGASWSTKSFEATTASTGLTKVGVDIRLDSSAAGDGLGFSAGVLSVGVDGSTVELSGDAVRLKDDGITNAKINSAAAIAYSKLALTGSILNADINASAAIAYSKLNLSGSILNADVNASAAIAHSKMAALTASKALVSDGSGVVSASAVTSTELGHVAGVTSAIQTQLGGKAGTALDNLSIASLASQDLLVGSSSSAVARLGVGSNGQVLTVVAGNVAWASSAANSFSADWITADTATKAITHSLGTKDIIVQVYDKTDDSTIEVDSIVRTSTNVVTLVSSSAPPAAGFRVVILKA